MPYDVRLAPPFVKADGKRLPVTSARIDWSMEIVETPWRDAGLSDSTLTVEFAESSPLSFGDRVAVELRAEPTRRSRVNPALLFDALVTSIDGERLEVDGAIAAVVSYPRPTAERRRVAYTEQKLGEWVSALR